VSAQADALPDDPGLLKAMLIAERLESERLRQIIREFQHHRFGRRAESLPPASSMATPTVASTNCCPGLIRPLPSSRPWPENDAYDEASPKWGKATYASKAPFVGSAPCDDDGPLSRCRLY
jgi:hypothetical protein